MDVKEQKTHPKDECQRLWGWGKGPSPPDTHWGALYSPGGKTGELRAPNGHCVHPPASGLSPWPDDWLEGSFLEVSQGLGGGSEMPAPWALPHPFCLQVSKQYILGVSSAPTPDLSWQVWVPLFLPWEGLEQDRKLGVSELCTGWGVGSFRAWHLSRAWEWGHPLYPRPALLHPHPCPDSAVSPLPHSGMVTGGGGARATRGLGGAVLKDLGQVSALGLVTCPGQVLNPSPPSPPLGPGGSHPTNVCKVL